MIPINIRRNSNGVPILKQTEIDLIAEALVYDFCPEVLNDPQPVDVDAFCESYMKLHLDYQYLSNNGVYLGMTVFDDTDKVVVFDPVLRRAEYTSVKAGTVIIDNTLLETNQEHRYRFTMGHEAAGHLLEGKVLNWLVNKAKQVDSTEEEVETAPEATTAAPETDTASK